MPEKQLKCQSCGICIGPDFMEPFLYPVGDFTICGWCLGKLRAHGHTELDGRRPIKGQGTVCRWLYPDGSVKLMRVILKLGLDPQFVSLDVPFPEELLIASEDEMEEE